MFPTAHTHGSCSSHLSFFLTQCSTKLWEKTKQALTAAQNIISLPGLCYLCSASASQPLESWRQQKHNPIGCISSPSMLFCGPHLPSLSCDVWGLFLSATTEWSGKKRLHFCYYVLTEWKLSHCYLDLGNGDFFFPSLEIPRFLVEMQMDEDGLTSNIYKGKREQRGELEEPAQIPSYRSAAILSSPRQDMPGKNRKHPAWWWHHVVSRTLRDFFFFFYSGKTLFLSSLLPLFITPSPHAKEGFFCSTSLTMPGLLGYFSVSVNTIGFWSDFLL